MSVKAFPTEFPKDAAAKIGAAILAKDFSFDLIEPAYDLLGYALGRVFGSSKPYVPTVGATAEDLSDEALAAMLQDAASLPRSVAPKAAESTHDVDAIPWGLVILLAQRIIADLLRRK